MLLDNSLNNLLYLRCRNVTWKLAHLAQIAIQLIVAAWQKCRMNNDCGETPFGRSIPDSISTSNIVNHTILCELFQDRLIPIQSALHNMANGYNRHSADIKSAAQNELKLSETERKLSETERKLSAKVCARFAPNLRSCQFALSFRSVFAHFAL